MNTKLLKSYPTNMEAEMGKNLLETQGIKVIMQSSKPGMTSYLGNINGADLYVREEDFEKASLLIKDENL